MTPLVSSANVAIRTLVAPADRRRSLRDDVHRGLSGTPRWLPPKYFYDDRGSELFEAITRLPEYYPTRAEQALLEKFASEIAAAADAHVLLELGSGSSEKTKLLLDAFDQLGHLVAYVPVDVSGGALLAATENLALTRPNLPVYPMIADFERHLTALPRPGQRLVALLGSTIGNFVPEQRAAFFRQLEVALRPGEAILLGADLVKDPERLVAAYDDAAGVTAKFNRNVLHVLNRELAGDFEPDTFDHVAVWDSEREWIEMRLRARSASVVTLRDAGLVVELAAGEEIRTEISAKFRRETLEAELTAAGFRPIGWWSDGDYALILAQRP